MKLIKKLTVLLICLWIGQALSAQSLSYEITANDPAFNNTMIMPFVSTYTSLASTFSLGGGIEVIDRHLPVYLRLSADIPLLDARLIKGGKSSKILELGAEFPLIKNANPISKKVTLKSTSVSSTSVRVTSIMVEGVKVEKSILVRGGLMSYTGHYDETFLVEDLNTNYGVAGSFNVTGLYAGISSMRRMDVSIHTNEYGTTRNTSYFQLYADVLFAASVNPGTWDALADRPPLDVKNDLGMKTSPIGLRVGVYSQFPGYKSHNTNGWGIKSELGFRPGPVSETKFLLVTVFYTFNLK